MSKSTNPSRKTPDMCPYCKSSITRLPDHLPCESVPATEDVCELDGVNCKTHATDENGNENMNTNDKTTNVVSTSHNGDTPKVYHSDPTCFTIVNHTRDISDGEIKRRRLRECMQCADEVDRSRKDQYRPLRVRIESGELEI